MHETLNDRGLAIASQAKREQGMEADRLLRQACDTFARAVELYPDSHKALNNWGIVLTEQASRKQGNEAEKLYQRAIDVYERALRVQPRNSHTLYNMGCLEAGRGRTIEALAWLERWRGICPSTPRRDLDEDQDFDRIRAEPAFREFVESLPV